MSPRGTGPVNYEYAGSMPMGFDNEIRYQDMIENQKIAQYQDQVSMAQQQAAQSRAANYMSPKAYGSGSDELAKRMYQRQAYLGRQAHVAGIMGGSVDFAAFSGASAVMGMGITGGISAVAGKGAGFMGSMAVPMIAAAAVSKPFMYGVNKRLRAEQQAHSVAADFDMYGSQMGFNGGMSFQQATRAGYEMRSSMNNMAGGFFDRDQLSRISKIGMSNGLVNARGGAGGGGDLAQYKKNFKELTETTEEIVKTLKTTIEGGMSVMKELKQAGYTNGQMKQQLKQIAAVAGSTGMSTQNVISMGAAGANAVQGTPYSAQLGSSMYVQNMGVAGNMKAAGDARAVARVGGVAQAGAAISNAQLNFMSSGIGNKMMAYVMTDGKTINKDRLNAVLDGKVSGYELINGANNNGYHMGASGRSLFELKKQEAVDNLSAGQIGQMWDAGFKAWGQGRYGTREAKSYQFAKMYSNNAREAAAVHAYNMRVRGVDGTALQYEKNEMSNIANMSMSRDKTMLENYISHGRFSKPFVKVGGDISGIGEATFDTLNSKEAHKFYGSVRAGLGFGLAGAAAGGVVGAKGGWVGAAIGATAGFIGGTTLGAMKYNSKNTQGGGWSGKTLSFLGLVDRNETFKTGQLASTEELINSQLGITSTQTQQTGLELLAAKEAAGINVTAGLRKAKVGNATAGVGVLNSLNFDGMSAAEQGKLTALVGQAQLKGGVSGLFDNKDFNKIMEGAYGDEEWKKQKAIAVKSGTGYLNDLVAGLNQKREQGKSEVTRLTASVEAKAHSYTMKEQKAAQRQSTAVMAQYNKLQGNYDMRQDFGLGDNFTMAEFEEANRKMEKYQMSHKGGKGYTTAYSTTDLSREITKRDMAVERNAKTFDLKQQKYDTSAADKGMEDLMNEVIAGGGTGYSKAQKKIIMDRYKTGGKIAGGIIGGITIGGTSFGTGTIIGASMGGWAGGIAGSIGGLIHTGLGGRGQTMSKRVKKSTGVDITTQAGRRMVAESLRAGEGDLYEAMKLNSGLDQAGFDTWSSNYMEHADNYAMGQAANLRVSRNDIIKKHLTKGALRTMDTSKRGVFLGGLGDVLTGKNLDAKKFVTQNRGIFEDQIGIGTGGWDNFVKDITGAKLGQMLSNQPGIPAEVKMQSIIAAEDAVTRANKTVAKYNNKDGVIDLEKVGELTGKEKEAYQEAREAKYKADKNLKELTQEKKGSTNNSTRTTAINPPVLSYWNNNWAVR